MPFPVATEKALDVWFISLSTRDTPATPDELQSWTRRVTAAVIRELEREGVTIERAPRIQAQDDVEEELSSLAIQIWQEQQRRTDVFNPLSFGSIRNRVRRFLSTARRKATEVLQRAVGIHAYRWTTEHDIHVRRLHRELNGQIFRWDTPHPTEGHPGDAWGCRCTAKPLLGSLS